MFFYFSVMHPKCTILLKPTRFLKYRRIGFWQDLSPKKKKSKPKSQRKMKMVKIIEIKTETEKKKEIEVEIPKFPTLNQVERSKAVDFW